MSNFAFAGHYTAGTTSGLTASPSASLTFGAGSASASPGVGGTGAASIGGTINTPFTWVPDYSGEPPAQAVVIESCNVSASGYCFPAGD